MSKRNFNQVGGLKPRRNAFDLSYRNAFTCDMGQLIPVYWQECVPGDHFTLGNNLTVRFQPLVSPVLEEIQATIHYFFFPMRLAYQNDDNITNDIDFEEFISQGLDGTQSFPLTIPKFGDNRPRVRNIGTDPNNPLYDMYELVGDDPEKFPGSVSWTEAMNDPRAPEWITGVELGMLSPRGDSRFKPGDNALGTLWDYFGLPVEQQVSLPSAGVRAKVRPIDMPWRTYNTIYNEYYRDQNLQEPVSLFNNRVLNRNWMKDYFTASLPFQQKGIAPALPVSLQFNPSALPLRLFDVDGNMAIPNPQYAPNTPMDITFAAQSSDFNPSQPGNIPRLYPYSKQHLYTNDGQAPNSENTNVNWFSSGAGIWSGFAGVNMDETSATTSTFDVSDLRLAFQIQKWMERNARTGTRYTEFLRGHFGVSPSDSRLDRPEYIGGVKMPIVISEVVQTSGTINSGDNQSPQANMAGHGLGSDSSYAGKYFVQEYGYIMGIMSVMPKPTYQQGINRMLLRETPIDMYFPEFAHLSEQEVFQSEIYWTASDDQNIDTNPDTGRFGFIPVYDEMRVRNNQVCSEMRVLDGDPANPWDDGDLSFWNLARYFPDAPNLNSEFITCVPDKRIFAVWNVPGLIVNCQNLVKAVRPMPSLGEPGLIDHN